MGKTGQPKPPRHLIYDASMSKHAANDCAWRTATSISCITRMRTAPVEPAVYGSTNTSGVEKKPSISWLKSPKIIADAGSSVPLVKSDGTLLVTASRYP